MLLIILIYISLKGNKLVCFANTSHFRDTIWLIISKNVITRCTFHRSAREHQNSIQSTQKNHAQILIIRSALKFPLLILFIDINACM